MKHIIIIFFAFLFFIGCAVPKPELTFFPKQDTDFTLCPENLRMQYADIARFEGSFSRYFLGYRGTRPDMSVLIKEWGEPRTKRPSLRNLEAPVLFLAVGLSGPWVAGGSAFIWSTLPSTVYVWEKGDYTIEGVATNPAVDGYVPSLSYWIWTYNGAACQTEISKQP